jgi:hypothetical protein
MFTLKQAKWLSLELRRIVFENVEPVAKPDCSGMKHAAYILEDIITTPEESQNPVTVAFNLGFVVSLIVERKQMPGLEVMQLVSKATDFDPMYVTASVAATSAPAPSIKAVDAAPVVEPTKVEYD